LIVIIACVISGWFFVRWLYQPESFPIRQVELVNQLNNQGRKELKTVAADAIKGGFFSLDVDKFRGELLFRLPWVESVAVRKIWPDRLLVSITEHQVVGRWLSIEKKDYHSAKKGADNIELISRNGVVFYPQLTSRQNNKFNQMAVLTGPEISAKKILKHCFKINESLKQLDSRVQRCGMNERRSWLITLDNGIVIKLGKENMMPNLIEFNHIFSGQLKKYFELIENADLRFSNGFSIKWKNITNEDDTKTNERSADQTNGNRQEI